MERPAFLESELDAVRSALGRQIGAADAAWTQADEVDKADALTRSATLQDLAARTRRIIERTRRAAVLGTPVELEPAPTETLLSGAASPLEAAVATLHQAADPDPGLDEALAAWRTQVQATDVGPLPRHLVEAAQLEALSTRRVAEGEKRKANEAADEARRQAEEARREARDARSRRVATVLEKAAAAQAQAQAAWERTEAEAVRLERFQESAVERRDQVASRYGTVAQLPALDPARSSTAESAWVELRGLIRDLRREAITARGSVIEADRARTAALASIGKQQEELARAREARADFAEGELLDDLTRGVEGWSAALTRQSEAVAHLDKAQSEHVIAVLADLQQAKEDRRRYRSLTPRSVIAQDRDTMLADARVEVALLLPNLRGLVARRVAQLQDLRESGSTWAAISATAVGSFWVLAGFLVWWWVRVGVRGWVGPAAERAARRSGGLLPADFAPFEASAIRVGRALTDLVALTLLIAPTRLRLPELAALLTLARLVALFHMLWGMVHLALAPRDEGRPAFFRLERASWKRALRSVRILLVLTLASAFAEFLAINLLGTEALGALAGLVFGWTLFATLLVQLWRVEPKVRAAVAVSGGYGRLHGWIAQPRGTPTLSRPVRAGLGIGWLASHRGWQLLQGSARDGTALGALVGILERRQQDGAVKDEGPEAGVPRSLVRKLVDAVAEVDLSAPTDLVAHADRCFAAWRDHSDARGQIAVVAYMGQGKDRWARAWAAAAADSCRTPLDADDHGPTDLAVTALSVPNRLLDEGALLPWLGQELATTADTVSVLAALEKRPPSIFVVEGLEFGFLRQVGGFSAVRALLEISGQSDRRHFWVFTAHAPAWRYLSRLRRVLNPDAFQAVLELPRLNGVTLREVLFAAVAQVGCTLDLSGLVRPGTVSGDPEGDRERATVAFFRLLAEASRGNTGVATQLFLQSLRASEDGRRLQLLGMDRLLELGEASLSDVQQLIGAALDVHVALNADEVAKVANLPLGVVRPALRLLEDREIIEPAGRNRFKLALAGMPGVVQALRRRHFVYGRD